MGLFEKIKNALFEEEYVEIEEKPKKPKKEVFKKEIERPIAKKVILPKKEEVKIEENINLISNIIGDDLSDVWK